MTPTFHQQLATQLLETYPNIEDVKVVLPGKRSGVFLRRALVNSSKKTMWAPSITTLESFVFDLIPLKSVDPITLQFEVYEVYLGIEPNPQPFEEFSNWAPQFISEINEVDAYLLDAEAFFQLVNEARALEQWNVSDEPLTEIQINYLAFWKLMGKLYKGLRTRLFEKKWAYRGMAFRYLVEHKEAIFAEHKEPIVFAGFNALSASEKELLHWLEREQYAQLFWDADTYYLEDPKQEAGKFLREEFKRTGSRKNWVSKNLLEKAYEVEVHACSSRILQLQKVAELLQGLSTDDLSETVVVIGEETDLPLLLESLPSNVEKLNVTLGFPLKNTLASGFLLACLRMQQKAIRLKKQGKRFKFYHKDVLQIVQHAILLPLARCQELAHVLAKAISKQNMVYLEPKRKVLDPYREMPFFVELDDSFQSLSGYTTRVIQWMKEELFSQDDPKFILENEALFQLNKSINQLDQIKANYEVHVNFSTAYTFVDKSIRQEQLALYGEPLSGLQIMGILETRTLDFKRVIYTSVNEGVLPKSKHNGNFIPNDLRISNGLPTHHDREALFAYHFYRLMQRADHIHLMYSTQGDSFKPAVPSRYLQQILWEWPKSNKKVKLNESSVGSETRIGDHHPLRLEKTPELIADLKAKLESSFSPSAMNDFLESPLDGYYKHVAKLRESDQVEEDIESSTFGSIIHEVMEDLYTDCVGKEMTIAFLDQCKGKIEETLKAAYEKKFRSKELFGNTIISFHVAKEYIHKLLAIDQELIEKNKQKLRILALEQRVERIVEVQGVQVRFSGIVDRIDELDGETRVIDYKSGKVEAKDVKISSLDQFLSDKPKPKALQLLLYAWMYKGMHPHLNALSCGNISLRQIKSKLITFQYANEQNLSNELFVDFEETLKIIVWRLLDPSVPFEANPDYPFGLFQ